MIELLSFQFVQYALIAGVFVAVICSLAGVTVVTRNMSILGDSLSHISFASATIALFFNMPVFFITIPAAVLGAFFISEFSKNSDERTDAYVAAISSFAIALGVLVASQTRNISIDIESFLFGGILTIQKEDLYVLAACSIALIMVFVRYYRNIFMVLFDADFAKASRINTDVYLKFMSVFTGIVVALSMKVVGALLVSALLVLPAFSAFKLAKSFISSIFLSVGLAVLSVLIGMMISLVFRLPTGATIAVTSGVIFFGIILSVKRR